MFLLILYLHLVFNFNKWLENIYSKFIREYFHSVDGEILRSRLYQALLILLLSVKLAYNSGHR